MGQVLEREQMSQGQRVGHEGCSKERWYLRRPQRWESSAGTETDSGPPKPASDPWGERMGVKTSWRMEPGACHTGLGLRQSLDLS